jgi:type IV secretory pathway VirJ component
MSVRSLAAAFVAALVLAAPVHAQEPERVSHGRFTDVALYKPAGEPKAFVLFLSGDGGWNQGVDGMARSLVSEGAIVAGIDVPRFLASFAHDGASCVYPDGDLENLSHYLQGYLQLPTYYTPVLVGYSSGATLAYAMLAQAPSGTFAAGVSLGFCPDLALTAPPCTPAGQRHRSRAELEARRAVVGAARRARLGVRRRDDARVRRERGRGHVGVVAERRPRLLRATQLAATNARRVPRGRRREHQRLGRVELAGLAARRGAGRSERRSVRRHRFGRRRLGRAR